MKQYTYHLFLRNPHTLECKVQTITVTNKGYMDANLLFQKLTHFEGIDSSFSLVGLNVGQVVDLDEETT